MRIKLYDHDYRFAVEQTVMALLPDQTIETIDIQEEIPENTPYLKTYLVKNENTSVAKATLHISSHSYEGAHTYTTGSNEVEIKQQDQYALKESIYQAVIQYLPSPPPWGNLTGVRPAKLATKLLLKEHSQGENYGKISQETLETIYHVDKERSKIAVDCGKISINYQEKLKDTISLYAGIPFCPSRCGYCSFFSADVRQYQDKLPDYVKGVQWEMEALAPFLPKEKITTMYLGGGTPTVLGNPELGNLLQTMNDVFRSSQLLEFTVEAGRPDTITEEKLSILHNQGVHRISINPQTMNNQLLEKLGRNHSVEEILWAVSEAKGKFILNMDLIAGLRGDTPENFQDSLQQVLSLDPEQITVHALTLKKNTPYTEKKSKNISSQEESFNTVTDVQSTDKNLENTGNILESMLNDGNAQLKSADYLPYYLYRQKKIAGGLENIGWAKKNFQGAHQVCVYNIAMMEEFQSIIAFGAGGMSKFIDQKGNLKRHQNPKYFWEYLDKLPEIVETKKKYLENLWKSM